MVRSQALPDRWLDISSPPSRVERLSPDRYAPLDRVHILPPSGRPVRRLVWLSIATASSPERALNGAETTRPSSHSANRKSAFHGAGFVSDAFVVRGISAAAALVAVPCEGGVGGACGVVGTSVTLTLLLESSFEAPLDLSTA